MKLVWLAAALTVCVIVYGTVGHVVSAFREALP